MKKFGIIGSGNCGTCMARLIAENLQKLDDFDKTVQMWVHDELVEGESLVKIINTTHENVKYLPGIKLPETIVAEPDLVKVAQESDYFLFVIPHQFLPKTCETMKGHVKPTAMGISMIKGITFKDGEIELVTDYIERILDIKCSALMGANIASDIARGDFCESTVASRSKEIGDMWIRIISNEHFSLQHIEDKATQQICGCFKNIIALGAGMVDGLGYGQSTKAAIMRIGFKEMFQFSEWYYPGREVTVDTMMESCGFGDVVASSYGGRNARCGAYFAKTGKSIEECEKELLNGQKLQGNLAAAELYHLLKKKNAIHKFPMLSTIYLIVAQKVPPSQILHCVGPHLDIEINDIK